MYHNFDHASIDFDQAKTNSAMTFAMVLSAKVERNERLK